MRSVELRLLMVNDTRRVCDNYTRYGNKARKSNDVIQKSNGMMSQNDLKYNNSTYKFNLDPGIAER